MLPALHVAVNGAVAMGEAERGGDVGGDLGRSIGMQRALGLDDVGQAPTLDVLHDDEVGVVVLAPVVHGDDAGMVQVRRGLGFAAEAFDEGRFGGELREQDLHRDGPVEQLVAGQEDVGHAAPGETAMQLVSTVQHGTG